MRLVSMTFGRVCSVTSAILLVLTMSGCGSATTPVFTEEEQHERFVQEVSGEVKALVELEKKLGESHSQVRQMKMELGLDPDKPMSEQSL